MDKEVRKFMQSINVPGVEFEEGSKHIRVLLNGKLVTTLGRSPSDHRWKDNAISVLRKHGITPSVKGSGRVETRPEMSLEELRVALNEILRAKQFMPFIRFAVGEVDPLIGERPAFKDANSAASSLRQFASGHVQQPSRPGFLLATESVRMWRAREASVSKALAQTDSLTQTDSLAQIAQEVAESLRNGGGHTPDVSIVLNLDALNAALGKIGVRISIEKEEA